MKQVQGSFLKILNINKLYQRIFVFTSRTQPPILERSILDRQKEAFIWNLKMKMKCFFLSQELRMKIKTVIDKDNKQRQTTNYTEVEFFYLHSYESSIFNSIFMNLFSSKFCLWMVILCTWYGNIYCQRTLLIKKAVEGSP